MTENFRERLAERGRLRNEAARIDPDGDRRARLDALRDTVPDESTRDLVLDAEDDGTGPTREQRDAQRENAERREELKREAEQAARAKDRDEALLRHLRSGGRTKEEQQVERAFQGLAAAKRAARIQPSRPLVWGSPESVVFGQVAEAVAAAVEVEAKRITAVLVEQRRAAKAARAKKIADLEAGK